MFYYELLSQEAEAIGSESNPGACDSPDSNFFTNSTLDSKFVAWEMIHWATLQPHCIWVSKIFLDIVICSSTT